MIDRFQGDPRLVLTENGAKIIFTGGQPILDAGVENQALIALFTTQGWAGNILFTDPNQKIGSDFVAAGLEAITLTSLNKIRDAAFKALQAPIFGDISVEVTNPTSYQIKTEIIIKPPGEDPQTIILLKNGINWVLQGTDPASGRLPAEIESGILIFNQNKITTDALLKTTTDGLIKDVITITEG